MPFNKPAPERTLAEKACGCIVGSRARFLASSCHKGLNTRRNLHECKACGAVQVKPQSRASMLTNGRCCRYVLQV